ncbi:polysaccharide biosynthesis C-terminal domain-containing protein [Neobacillus drentensis]
MSETTVSGLVFLKKSKLQVVVAVGACITNIIGNTLLVPKFGSQGAAISTGLSYIVFFTLRTVLSNKFFYVNYRLKAFYLMTAVTAIYALYNTFIDFNIGSVIGYVICITMLVALYWNDVKWGINYLLNTGKALLKRKGN